MFALRDRRQGALSLSAKIGLGIAACSLLLIAKPVMDGLARSKQSRNMAMHDVPAPLFDTVDIQGKPQRLADYRGQVVLVNIWATWCEPCGARCLSWTNSTEPEKQTVWSCWAFLMRRSTSSKHF